MTSAHAKEFARLIFALQENISLVTKSC